HRARKTKRKTNRCYDSPRKLRRGIPGVPVPNTGRAEAAQRVGCVDRGNRAEGSELDRGCGHTWLFRQHESRMDDAFHPTPSRRQANSSPDPEMVESGNKRGRRMVGDEGRDATRSSGFTIARQRVPTLRIRSMAGGMAEEGGEGQS